MLFFFLDGKIRMLLTVRVLNMKKNVSLIVFLGLLAIGCAHVNYVGKSFQSTINVDLYFSKEDIEQEYTVMGHAIGDGTSDNNEIQTALIEEAKAKGADAVLITGIDNNRRFSEETIVHENEITASFLKYK